ncbi:lipid A ethanolaminephosphotransferase [Vibrio crassostreae]|uniref:Predicted membrane-associated, metal-dependent hydrolase n=3 Tax=Vibrio crassostreae TaxID=246167 RepID=A0A822MY78_9VIBR|nr:phosphoethanolamine--lipid A transferase [Vibrio crassostreae]MDH5949114.1 phosphoethanolamine--lipid A transferase [Vibrio crassostreae]ROR84144.1 phosphatidylethanolamine:Kdo2-lipid A phosphoethanolamine transferase [Vibrio crassostreae]TCN11481.1 phosphatidylethanolamine:Kdo2-lipid A phosphoethanolamine transferase [Vibrio crassostreae]TCT65261.1 phosphatidylethanolamine:Kdo2-lipid A phosphoethanolamine transferase [Vibrio crassostreae]TCT76663.1 phosphatidylethanolamine:Kdo2-lipid A pho
MNLPRLNMSINKLPFVLAVYYLLVINLPISRELFNILSASQAESIGFIISIPFFFLAAFNFIFQVFNWPIFAKAFFILLLLTSSLVSYSMFNYGIFVDYGMIENVFETNSGEAASYLSSYSILWFVLMGGVPSLLLLFTDLERESWKGFAIWKAIGLLSSLIVIAIIAGLFYKDYASIGRNNSHLKKMIIPTEYVASTAKYINNTYIKEAIPYQEIGLDAQLKPEAKQAEKPTLLVFVLGETARVYNYQYYGYEKETNDHTKPYNPIFFSDVQSCGTATAVSVPCMFSNMNRSNYDRDKAYNQDNVVDIMNRAGIHSIWREHDGGDKAVAHRIKEMTLVAKDSDPLCNNDVCYDTAMLENFEQDTQDLKQDSIIFYHISGSHGPTYFERYPEDHKKFVPDCPRSDIENCTKEQVVNTYDNTILYTDFFLSQAIQKLEKLTDKYNVALMYISDHGESLGENGIYLHGMPYSLAPKEQTHVPMILWMSDGFAEQKGINQTCLRKAGKEQSFSQDNLFDSLLGLMDVQTKEYRENQDIFAACR